MAKTEKTKVQKVEGGMVSIGMGIKVSSNYNTSDFNINVTLPINTGESPEQAVTRVNDFVATVFNDKTQDAMNLLGTHITQRKTPGR